MKKSAIKPDERTTNNEGPFFSVHNRVDSFESRVALRLWVMMAVNEVKYCGLFKRISSKGFYT